MPNMNPIQLHHNVKHKLFDRQQTAQYDLSLYIGKDEISYAVINTADNMVILLKSFRLADVGNFFTYKLSVNDFFEQEELLRAGFSRINVAINAAPYTVVPEKYYDSSKAEKYFSLNHPSESSGKLHSDYLESVRAYLIYAVDYYLLDVLEKNLVMFQLYHSHTTLLRQIAADNNGTASSRLLHINVQKHHIDLVALADKSLQLMTSNYIDSPTDLLYYALNAAQKSGIDPAQDHIVMTGDINADYPHYKLSQRYMAALQLGKRPADLRYCSEADILPPNSHYNLLATR